MQTSDSESFQHTIKGCIKQRREAQNRLYTLFYSYGMSICVRYTTHESDAIALLNSGFLKVFSNIKKYDARRDFKPWFRIIIVNTALNYVNREGKREPLLGEDDYPEVATDEQIVSSLQYKDLIVLIRKLPTAYRTVFNLYVLDGYKHHEIAEKLGISVGTSKSNLARAKGKLKEALTDKKST